MKYLSLFVLFLATFSLASAGEVLFTSAQPPKIKPIRMARISSADGHSAK